MPAVKKVGWNDMTKFAKKWNCETVKSSSVVWLLHITLKPKYA